MNSISYIFLQYKVMNIMETNVRKLFHKDMELICKWFQNIANTINDDKNTQEKIKEDIPRIISHYIEIIANLYIDDEWHPYDKNNMPKYNDTLITRLKDNKYLIQTYSQLFKRFELNDEVIEFKHIKIKN